MKAKQTKSKKINVRVLLIVVTMIVGMVLVLYPLISNVVEANKQKEIITTYQTVIDSVNPKEIENQYVEAKKYNDNLLTTINRFRHTNKYDNIFNCASNNMIGYISIPKIDVNLPIYHGTDKSTLSAGIGHMEGTSFPIDQKGTHAVLVGHSGMVQQDMFTNLTQMEKGDIFTVTVANREVTYEVDEINTVLPDELDLIKIEPNKSYCTLVTCVPYGINSHRLLVRGHQVNVNDYSKNEITVKNHKIRTVTKSANELIAFVGLALIIISAIISIIKIREKRI